MNWLKFFATGNINTKEVLKYLPDAVLVIENDGKIIWGNYKAFRMFHCFQQDMIDVNIDEFLVEGFILIEDISRSKKSVITGAIAVNNDEFFVELSARKYGEQYFVTLRDTTKLTKVFDSVEKTGKLSKEKNLMLYKLSNDFKSPVDSIEKFSKALQEGLCGEINEKQGKYLEIINKNAKELLEFMNKFFDFSYAESSAFQPILRPFDVIFVAQNILKDFEEVYMNRKFDIDVDFEELKKKIVYTDEKIFKNILKTLLEIAVSKTETGKITLKISNLGLDEMVNFDFTEYNEFKETSYLKLEIQDTGCGFGATELKTLFEPYSILETSNKKAIQNSLTFEAIRIMVKKLRGDFKVESEVMKGSVYTVILPVEKDKELKYE